MCINSTSHSLAGIRAAARLAIPELKSSSLFSDVTSDLEALLETGTPLVPRLADAVPGQINASQLLRLDWSAYPALLKEVVGPPPAIGPDPLLGYITAECALTALRRHEFQAALSALFLTTLCALELEEPAVEAVHHLLVECDAEGLPGLFGLGATRAGVPPEELLALRQRQSLKFVTTAVQLSGTFDTTAECHVREDV